MLSNEIKGIEIRDSKVYLTASVTYRDPSDLEVTWECEEFTDILRNQGKLGLYARIGAELWGEDLTLEPGNELCRMFLEAKAAFPTDMTYRVFDSLTAGNLLAEMVMNLEQEPHADLSGFVARAFALMNDRTYIINAAKHSGMNYLDYACEELQKDRGFAFAVLKAGHESAWFSYPKYYASDKDFALQALKLRGTFFRGLDRTLRADRDVIMEAFREDCERASSEFLPDYIPMEALYKTGDESSRAELDKDFIFDLLEACPTIHLSRSSQLLNDRDVVLRWIQVGRFFPAHAIDLPKELLTDHEVQEALTQRCRDDNDEWELQCILEIKGVAAVGESLTSKIVSAAHRAGNAQSPVEEKEPYPEH